LFTTRSFYKSDGSLCKISKPVKSEFLLYNYTLHVVTQNLTISILFLITLSLLFLLWSFHIMKQLHVMAIHTPGS